MSRYSRVGILVFADVVLINIAFVFALMLRFDFQVGLAEFINYIMLYIKWSALITIIKISINAIMGLYNSLWEYASIDELLRVFISAIFGLIFTSFIMVYFQQPMPGSIYVMVFILDIIFCGGFRFGYRVFRTLRRSDGLENFMQVVNKVIVGKENVMPDRVLIIGAGDAGASMIKEIHANPKARKKIIGVIDDDISKYRTRIAGKKVMGNRYDIPAITQKYRIDEIIIAIPSGGRKEVQVIADICGRTGCKTSILPAYIDLIDGKVSISNLRKVDICDLLGRKTVSLNIEDSEDYIKDKTILITGSGGSIGSELCRQIALKQPGKIVAMDIYENNLHDLCVELRRKYHNLKLIPVIASIQNPEMLERIFKTHQPDVVFHAAAHKHVPLMERNPREALLNNVLGTKNIVDITHKFGAEKFILISTDKAVNPTNVMGATKRIAEMLVQNSSFKSDTIFSAVRFGNVLGSNGSVIPLFKKQIETGGPVTVTHKEVTRYFMTIREAVQLVIQTGAMAGGGEIFILDMGESVRIKDLAENMIRLSGYTPYRDIDIVYTGLRPGEKLYEELLTDEEGIQRTSNNCIFIGGRTGPSPALLEILGRGENSLEDEIMSICHNTDEDIKRWLKQIVPGYSSENEKISQSVDVVRFVN